MSTQSLTDFLAKMTEDAALRDEVFAAVKAADNRLTVAAEVARKHGYEFTDDELKKILDAAQGSEPAELTEEELEAVAAGRLVFQLIKFAPPYVPVGPDIGQKLQDPNVQP
jgi:predicted ribosomally synthesized peptide with nif11-like leader